MEYLPQSAGGKVVSAVLMVFGVMFMAMPNGMMMPAQPAMGNMSGGMQRRITKELNYPSVRACGRNSCCY